MSANLYEAMFLVDSARSGTFPSVVRHIAALLRRHQAEIERIEKWAEQKLVYPIRGVERGIYVLVFLRLEPDGVAELRRDINMSEEIMRVLIVKDPLVSAVKGELYDEEGRLSEQPEAESVAATEATATEETQVGQRNDQG